MVGMSDMIADRSAKGSKKREHTLAAGPSRQIGLEVGMEMVEAEHGENDELRRHTEEADDS
jgi:hypothetical protein